jgi:hypothetical protein
LAGEIWLVLCVTMAMDLLGRSVRNIQKQFD